MTEDRDGAGGSGEFSRGDAPRILSDGSSPTVWRDEQINRFLEAGSELPPDLLREQKAVFAQMQKCALPTRVWA